MPVYVHEIEIPRPSHLGGSTWKLANLEAITILFGKNSSGKSLLLRSWRDSDVANTHYVAPERIGDIILDPSQIQAQMNPEGRRKQSQKNYSNNYRQQVITRITNYFAIRGGYRGVDPSPGDPAEIERNLGLLIPDFDVTLSPSTTPPLKLTRISTGEEVTNVDQLSSGEAQVLTVGLDIITIAAIWDLEKKEQRILLIDEPDAHLHPDLQTRFADFLSQVALLFDLQVVVATHSTTLLAALANALSTEVSVIYLDRTLPEFRARLFDAVQREIAACLGGHVLMGPLFGASLLLVEGDDDGRIWGQVPRHHVVNLSVIPCGGEQIRKYQKSLESIFRSIADPPARPFGFALLDGDKPLPESSPDNLQQYVKFIRLSCREAENLFLTDEVLTDLGHTWSEAAEIIVNQSSNYGEKQELLSGATAWDRQNQDLKNLIGEVSMILDRKSVHWTIRVGHAIGRSRPTGHLAEFLSSSVIEALWGEDEAEQETKDA